MLISSLYLGVSVFTRKLGDTSASATAVSEATQSTSASKQTSNLCFMGHSSFIEPCCGRYTINDIITFYQQKKVGSLPTL